MGTGAPGIICTAHYIARDLPSNLWPCLQRDVSPGPEGEGAVTVEGVLVPAEPAEPAPPEVEWWDRNLLATGSYQEDIGETGVAIKESKVRVLPHLYAHCCSLARS